MLQNMLQNTSRRNGFTMVGISMKDDEDYTQGEVSLSNGAEHGLNGQARRFLRVENGKELKLDRNFHRRFSVPFCNDLSQPHSDITQLHSDDTQPHSDVSLIRLPLCLAAKDHSPHSLPVYCGTCTHNGILLSSAAIHPGVVAGSPVPLPTRGIDVNEVRGMSSVIGHSDLSAPRLTNLPSPPQLKLQLSPLDKEQLSPSVECECHWMQCDRHFFSMDDLVNHVNDQHVKVERPDVDYQCKWTGCPRQGKGFNARYKMLIHIRTHTNEKPHRCNLCGKCFSRLENLKIHNRSHTGEKPFLCPFDGCTKAYSNSSDRFKHVRTHQEEKPYICKMPGCNKRYTDPSSLRKHVRTIGHFFRVNRTSVLKTKQNSPSSPLSASPLPVPGIIPFSPSNGILGNIPTNFMSLTPNIFPISALPSTFSPPVISPVPDQVVMHSSIPRIDTSDPGSNGLDKRRGSSAERQMIPLSPICQDGPLDLSRSPLPQLAKDEEVSDAFEHVQVD